jgi:hypothetical protein
VTLIAPLALIVGSVDYLVKQVPSLKARAEWIPQALKILRENEGNYEKMEEGIAAYWREISPRVKVPSKRNSLRAVFGPTLRHLELIAGEGDNIRLLPKGKQLLELWEKQGDVAFKKAYAEHLVKIDTEEWVGVISELRTLSEPASITEFLNYLKKKHPDSMISHDRLKKLLSDHYGPIGLVGVKDGKVELKKPQLERLLKGLKAVPSEDEFTKVLFDAYEKIQPSEVGNPYVPIPEIREKVCEMTGMWPQDFDNLLAAMPKETPEYLIHLTQPMLRESGGIRLENRYLYYIAIFRKAR